MNKANGSDRALDACCGAQRPVPAPGDEEMEFLTPASDGFPVYL